MPAVERLKGDYVNRTETMDDDLSFIQEVMAGASTAIPEFNGEAVRLPAPLCLLCPATGSPFLVVIARWHCVSVVSLKPGT